MPFWVSIIIGLAGVILFPFFIEGLFLFLLSDLLYGVEQDRFHGILFLSSIIILCIILLLEGLKKKLKFYNNDLK
ncbi:MAG: hypothetical protein QG583_168 [Patescibacteria group bacterium]|nr:hypothetical protein [Patescibacteria group bacterium]